MSIYACYSVPQFSTTNKELDTEYFPHLGNLFKTRVLMKRKVPRPPCLDLKPCLQPVADLSPSTSDLKAAYAYD
jgi:hypothetical protein